MSLAAYIAFYSSGISSLESDGLHLSRREGEYVARDDRFVLEFFYAHKDDDTGELVHAVMKNRDFWGMDLTEIENFENTVNKSLTMIKKAGVISAFASCLY